MCCLTEPGLGVAFGNCTLPGVGFREGCKAVSRAVTAASRPACLEEATFSGRARAGQGLSQIATKQPFHIGLKQQVC